MPLLEESTYKVEPPYKVIKCLSNGLAVYPKGDGKLGAQPIIGTHKNTAREYVKKNKADLLKAFKDYTVEEIADHFFLDCPEALKERLKDEYAERVAIMVECIPKNVPTPIGIKMVAWACTLYEPNINPTWKE